MWVRRPGRLAAPSATCSPTGYANRARAFAARIGNEDGTAATADAAEDLLASSR